MDPFAHCCLYAGGVTAWGAMVLSVLWAVNGIWGVGVDPGWAAVAVAWSVSFAALLSASLRSESLQHLEARPSERSGE
ncbi:MAG: hypothetical protein F4233_13150 [Rhodospirillaceae bacterium]|nr:hypothetical protein [Rhodospirillaceae bacterium]